MLEQLLDAGAVFGTGLFELLKTVLLSKLFAFAMRHFNLLKQIRLVADQANVAVLGSVFTH